MHLDTVYDIWMLCHYISTSCEGHLWASSARLSAIDKSDFMWFFGFGGFKLQLEKASKGQLCLLHCDFAAGVGKVLRSLFVWTKQRNLLGLRPTTSKTIKSTDLWQKLSQSWAARLPGTSIMLSSQVVAAAAATFMSSKSWMELYKIVTSGYH